NEVVSIDTDTIQPAPEGALSPETAAAITGVVEREGRLIILLDLDEAVPKTDYSRTASTDRAAMEGEADD
ncbi:MAG: hypothetical protein C4530_04830, partial [Desulfobacteraceae bacterium]